MMYNILIVALAMACYAGTEAALLPTPLSLLPTPLSPLPTHLSPSSPLSKRSPSPSLLTLIPHSSLPPCQPLCAPLLDLIAPCSSNNFTAIGCDPLCAQSAWDGLYACVQCNANAAKLEGKLFTPDQAIELRRDQLGLYLNCAAQGNPLRGRDFNLTIAGNANFQLMVSAASRSSPLGHTSFASGLPIGAMMLLGALSLL